MATLQELMLRAQQLRQETAVDSISPERAGGIMYDTLAYINQMQLQDANPLLISKIYASVAAMEADSAPVSDLTGKSLRPGQVVCIVPDDETDPDYGMIYRYDGTTGGTSSWTAVGKIGITGYQYMGVAHPGDTPTGYADLKCFWLAAEPGTYTNFGGIILDPAEVAVILWDGSWHKQSTGAVSSDAFFDIAEFDTVDVVGVTENGYWYSPQRSANAAMKNVKFPYDRTKLYLLSGLTFPSSGWSGRVYVMLGSDGQSVVSYGLNVVGPYTANNVRIEPDEQNPSSVTLVANGRASDNITLKEVVGVRLKGTFFQMKGILASCNLNDIVTAGMWLLVSNNTYQNVPENSSAGWLRVSNAGGYVLQEFIGFNGTVLYARRISVGDSISEWTKLNGSGDTYNITNNYSFPKYEETNTINVSPTITTDTNNYLAASGDTSDRTAEIVSMLQTTGVCRLGPGHFYVSGVQMPENTSIIGCGNSTIVHLFLSVTDGFAIKANSHCLIKDLCLQGRSSYSPSSTIGTRHGILFEGDYTQSQTAPLPCMISDVRIFNFEGGGITCYDTGVGTYDFVNATSVHIDNCGVGINIPYYSEYHKFTNVRAWNCYYGCINNGGNNMFVNCDFSRSIGKAFVMDNSQGQSPNNSHGSCVGCVFNHTANNTGIGIEILSCKNGFIFSGCQIFYSKMNLVDADGIVVQGCNFGTEEIILDWCGSVVFANNMFNAAPTVTKLRQSNIFASNNYVRSTGAAVTF